MFDERISDLRFLICDCEGGKPVGPEEVRDRTKAFALRVIRLVKSLPRSVEGRALGNQLIRSGTSVGAIYRAACRGRSRAESAAKMGVALEEADETAWWLELIIGSDTLPMARVQPLLAEANELVAILSATRASARAGVKSQITNRKS